MTSPHAVLIVDADPKGLESLVYGFQGAEWRLTACPSPETASLLVKASAAKLVLIASRSEHERMHSLVRQLRGKDATRSLPILVLGPEDLRPTLAQIADVDLLPLPSFVRDVLVASEVLVTAGSAGNPGEGPLWGATITSALILSVVRSMSGLSRSGHLRLERNGRAGEILFHHGAVTAASLGPLQAMAALQHLVIWNDGKLELRLRQVPCRGQLRMSSDELLQDLDRFQRDYSYAMREIGPATAMYVASHERLRQAGGAVPAEVTPVVRLCDGHRPLADVIDESPFRVLDTVRILGRLAALGILTRADGKPVLGTAVTRASSDDFLDTARVEGPDRAWPMPEPIGAVPAAAPFAISPTAPLSVGESPRDSDPQPASLPTQTPRPRRPTQEIVTPGSSANLPRQAPVGAAVPGAASGALPAARLAPGRPVTPRPILPTARTTPARIPLSPEQQVTPPPVTPGPMAQVTPPPVTPRPRVQVTPPPVTPAPVRHVTPARVMQSLSPQPTPAPVVPRPAAAPVVTRAAEPVTAPLAQPHTAMRSAGQVVTIMQSGSKSISPGAAAEPGSPVPSVCEPVQAVPSPSIGGTPAVPASPTVTARFAPASLTAATGVVDGPQAAEPSGPNAVGPITQITGVIESRKGERRSQHNLRTVGQPSVVVTAMPIEDVRPPAPPSSSSSSGRLPQAPAPGPEAVAPAKNPARITGTFQTAQARKGPGQTPPTPPVSIQLDTSLSDPFRSNCPTPLIQVRPQATSPAPFRSSSPTPPIPGTPASARVTGELQTVSSGRGPRSPLGKAPPAPSSFHIDPSLAAEAAARPPTPAPVPVAPAKRSDSQPTPGLKRRASGGFSAVESDFFAREADLYKDEKPESFADLEADKSKSNGKDRGKPGRSRK